MSSNDPNTAPLEPRAYNYVSGPADFAAICVAAGLDPKIYASKQFLQTSGMPALMELFSDGEQRFGFANPSANLHEFLAKSPQDRHGEFYAKIAELRAEAYAAGGLMEDEIHKLERYCGSALWDLVMSGNAILPQASNIVRPTIIPETGRAAVSFGDYFWHSNRDLALILEYGPGLAGTKWFDPQLNALSRGKLPYQYIGVSNGPFVNQFLLDALGARLEQLFGPGAGQHAADGQLFIPREDGMERSTSYLLSLPQPSGTHEMCDLILLTAVHKANARELERTITQSPLLLQPEGRMLLSAPLSEVEAGVTTFEQQITWALRAGYSIEWQGQSKTGDAALGTATTSGFAVLRK